VYDVYAVKNTGAGAKTREALWNGRLRTLASSAQQYGIIRIFLFSKCKTLMALTKTQKEEVIVDLREKLSDAKTIVFVNFKGLTVGESNKFRKALREAGVGYKVAKKTLISRVLDEKGLAGTMPALDGEVAIAYSSDMLAPAREVFNFSKGKATPSIVGGAFDGAYADKAQMLSIATIPPREVLLAQVLNLMNSPIQRFAVVLSEIAKTKSA